MRTLAFDGRMGASGDMILGALVAAGADPEVLTPVTSVLDVEYRVSTTTKNGISATSVDVLVADDQSADDVDQSDSAGADHAHDPDDHHHDHPHEHDSDGSDDHHHDHPHEHDSDDSDDHHHDHHHHHGHDHDGTTAEGHGPHRTLAEVHELVEDMSLPSGVAATARAIFDRLARAEAAVHGTDVSETSPDESREPSAHSTSSLAETPPDESNEPSAHSTSSLAETQFHEVGADDAVADVVGAALLLDDLAPERVVTTPLSTGDGEVSMAHGTYPVPAPAVVELAAEASWSLRGGPVEAELLTPTGAAILAEVADGVDSLPPLRVEASGYGAGGYDFEDRPNVLRAVVGDGSGRLVRDDITVLETNLDDATPETLGSLHESLREVGARDVSVLPASMKKSRPGHLVKVITKPEDAERVASRLAVETGTLGVREHGAGHRWVAERRVETVRLEVDGVTHDIAVKIASTTDGEVFDVSAEYDDAAAVAREHGLAVREVARRAEAQAREELDGAGD